MAMERKRKKETLEMKRFPAELISAKIKLLFNSKEARQQGIKETVGDPEIRFKAGNKLNLSTTILAETSFITPDAKVAMNVVLGNEGGGTLVVVNHTVKAKFDMVAEGVGDKLLGFINQISELLKADIEEEEGKKIEKIEIIKGEVRVTFKASETNPGQEIEKINAEITPIKKLLAEVKEFRAQKLYVSAEENLNTAVYLLERLEETKYEDAKALAHRAKRISQLQSQIEELKIESQAINEKIAADLAEQQAEEERARNAEIEIIKARLEANRNRTLEAQRPKRNPETTEEMIARLEANRNRTLATAQTSTAGGAATLDAVKARLEAHRKLRRK